MVCEPYGASSTPVLETFSLLVPPWNALPLIPAWLPPFQLSYLLKKARPYSTQTRLTFYPLPILYISPLQNDLIY